ncbi:HigA family addiction module antitoxin [Bacteroides sp. UBA939]|uniref:HigA family addiction module antitoxin n=1 Tax=Bacteroides sp. UBA939 TaxID=1946092 RepID=UPI0025C5A266|nr:HigA family addiction module antitoxin [Bacteroides sp. UBA939]
MTSVHTGKVEPFYPIHPGEILKEEIDFRGISQKKLAGQMGVAYSYLNEVLNCKRPVNTDFALRIEAALGLEPTALLNMQTRYNMQMAKKDTKLTKCLAEIRKAVAVAF